MRHIVNRAIEILESQARYNPIKLSSPDDTKSFLRLKLADRQHEVFAVMFLDTRHCLIAYEELFRGTINQASVYPREIVKRALELNASALVCCHNHPSGSTEPSKADESITRKIKDACELLDIRLLDHIIVGLNDDSTSMAEKGLL